MQPVICSCYLRSSLEGEPEFSGKQLELGIYEKMHEKNVLCP